ncbi:MAG TPA: hypothetical protein P5121_22695 [Caldilineaceae bacterium]|nr:hypothetical protein [Caldilineaceae bacterium]
MNAELVSTLQATQQELDPQFKALRAATAALKQAQRLAGEEPLDALAMQKALVKLQQANEQMQNEALQTATATFAKATQTALDGLAFDFARELKATFEARGESVEGRPPTLVVNGLTLQIDIGARKAQWLYGKEALTRPIPLSINGIVKAYDQQRRAILERTVDIPAFLAELYAAWQKLTGQKQRSANNYANLVAAYSQLTLDRQSARFWNAPSRSTFKDYDRAHFVRDLVLAHDAPTVTIDGTTYRLRLGVATKSQADSATRSIWLPQAGLDGEYYANVAFEEVDQ